MLIKRLRAQHDNPPADPAHEGRPEHASPLLWQLVFSLLAWETAPARAVAVNKRLHAEVLDYNELRVCLPEEIVAILGDRYSRAHERAVRLRSTLNDLFRRQHAVTLDHLTTMNKRDARAYLESLEGCPPYVAARIALFELDAHALPADERLMSALRAQGCLPEVSDPHAASTWLERQLRTGEAKSACLLLEAWVADQPEPGSRAKGSTRSASKGASASPVKSAAKKRSKDPAQPKPKPPGE